MEAKFNHFESLLVKTDVTALKLIENDHLIVGIGNILSLYKLYDKTLIARIKVFTGQKIHGFVQSNHNPEIAIYGGKQIKMCFIDTNQSTVILKDFHIECDDWILALIWIKNDTELALLTAHNVIQVWSTSSKCLKIIHKCDEKCILYSGLLKEINDDIIVFAGTVFSQIVIWSSFNETVLNRLIGHKGVIFSISYNDSKKLIVTTSDDRSVKLWSIDDDNIEKDEKYWKNVKISLKISLFGHTARVMRNVIVQNYIISIGEDAIMCIWNISGELIRKQKVYQDGCLWSLDCDLNKNIIVTGSGNSGVMMHRLVSNLNNIRDQIEELYFPNLASIAKCVAITARNNIVCLTEQGELIYYNKLSNDWCLYQADDVKPCSLTLSICRQYIALTDLNGVLCIFAETCKFEPKLIHCLSQKVCEGRIPSLIWLPDRNICICDNNGIISIWRSRGDSCEKINEFYLPSCKERWLTTATIIPDEPNSIIVGDRCGNIHLYEKDSAYPVQTLSKVHGRLGTNFIRIENDKVITVGRDSSVRFFSLQTEKICRESRLNFIRYIKLPFNWIDRFISKSDDLICGFREIDFVIWDLQKNQHLFEIKCGGGHRSWDIAKKWKKSNDSDLNEMILEFAFIKNSIIHRVDIKIEDVSKTIIDAFHVKEINSLASMKLQHNIFLIISAGEDNTLVFNNCIFDNMNVNFVNDFKISKHLSSIRSLCIVQSHEKYLVFSAGGRAQVCAWELISTGKDSRFECKELSQHLIKGTDIEKKGNKGWKKVEMNVDAEMRFMSLNCLSSSYFQNIDSNNSLILFSGCSDGLLRIFLFEHKFELIKSLNFDSKCILKVLSTLFKSHPIVFTTSTDGFVSIWDFSSLGKDQTFQPIFRKRYHKAGINSFDISHITEDKLIMATGGDDNDLQLNLISLSENCDVGRLCVKEVSKWHCDKYHSSQITNVKILNNYIISTSIDQRVTLLKITNSEYEMSNLDCVFISQYHSSVSDIQGMNILDNIRNKIILCLYGKGIEIVQLCLPL